MKYQQVSVDCVNMVFTAITYLALAGAGWIFLRLLQACFWLPKQLKKQNDIQQMLQDKVDSYEKYILECEEKEKAAAAAAASTTSDELKAANHDDDEIELKEVGEEDDDDDGESRKKNESVEKLTGIIDEKKWKERRECLEMLKKELKRVRDGGDMYDWDCLLEDDEKDEAEKVNSVASKEELNEKSDDDAQKDDKEKKYK